MSQSEFFEPLEHRLLLSAHTDWLQESAQMVELPPLSSVNVLDDIQAGQKQVYQFTASATGKVIIDMIAGGFDLDSFLTIYNAKGKKVKANDNAYKGTLNSCVILNVKVGQVYYVVAEGKGGTGGDYSLRLYSLPKDDVGNTTFAAKGLGNSLAKAATVNYAGDVDVFSFIAKSTGSMTLSMVATGKNNPIDGKLTILDIRGQVVAQSGGEAGPMSVTFTVQAGQTYYVQVESANDASGKYKLRRTAVSPANTPDGNNNNSNGGELPFDIPDNKPAGPGATITTQIVTSESGLQLIICGTDGNDTIVLSQTTAALTLVANNATFTFDGDFTSVVVYGFAGNDTINFTSTVTAQGAIYGGEGNDTYYLAGSGPAWVYGGLGDDLYVTVGGGQAIIDAGGGFNSYWVDKNDVIIGASAAETKAGAVHVIGEFYQPWTNDPTKADYIPLTPAGQNLRDPVGGSKFVNFSSHPLFVNGPGYTDIRQGGVGDCYFLASLSGLAESSPMSIQQAITPLGDGTYAVRFFRAGKEVYVRIDGDLPVNASGQLVYAQAGNNGSIWVPLMEKAYAFFRNGGNSYASLNGGWMADSLADLTGLGTTARTTGGVATTLYSFLQIQLNDGKAVTAGSTSANQGPIIGGHAYTVMSVQVINGEMTVTVYNPWGYDGVKYDSNPNDGLVTISIAQFQQYFTAVVASKLAA